MNRRLAGLTWPEIDGTPLVLVPVGSLEQHGPHLPFDTDTAIAVAVAEQVAARLDGVPREREMPPVIVAPPVAYGASGEHQSFAGTSSIGSEALRLLVIELVRSMTTWAGRIVFVNGHGGNAAALSKAVFQMSVEEHDVAWVPCATEDVDLHAGRTETSLMLHLRPDSVRLDRAEAGDTRPIAEIWPLLLSDGVAAVSPNGVLGDPSGASAVEGERVLAAMADDAALRIRSGSSDARGMLTVRLAETPS